MPFWVAVWLWLMCDSAVSQAFFFPQKGMGFFFFRKWRKSLFVLSSTQTCVKSDSSVLFWEHDHLTVFFRIPVDASTISRFRIGWCLRWSLYSEWKNRLRHISAQVTFRPQTFRPRTFRPQTFRPRTFRPKTHFGPAHFGQRHISAPHISAKDPLSIVNHSRLSMITFIFSRLATLQGLEGLKCLFSFKMCLWPKCVGPKRVFGRNVLGRNVSSAKTCRAEICRANMCLWQKFVEPKCVFGQNVWGRNVWGRNVLGWNVWGRNVTWAEMCLSQFFYWVLLHD